MRIRTQLYFIIAATLIMACAGTGLFYINWRWANTLADEFETVSAFIGDIESLRYHAYDYLLEPSERSEAQWIAISEQMKTFMETHSYQDREIRDLHEKILTDIENISSLFSQLMNMDLHSMNSESQDDLFKISRSRLISQIFLKINGNISHVFSLLGHRNQNLRAAQDRTIIINIVLIFLFIFIILTSAAITIRKVLIPFEALHSGIESVGKGNFFFKTGIRSKNEIGQLACAFENMAANLKTITASRDEYEALSRHLAHSTRELEQFSHVAAHDLQEPLRGVMSYTQLLAKRYEGQIDAEADSYIRYAVESATRMKLLINDFLDFITASKHDACVTPTDCKEAICQVRDQLEDIIETTGTKIVVENLPKVMVNPDQLEIVFKNLIENAIKFRSENRPVIKIGGTRKEKYWEITVADNGIGIAPEYHEKVFNIFQRLHARHKYSGRGAIPFSGTINDSPSISSNIKY